MTKTAIILLGQDELFIWAIPSLSPQQSDLRHFIVNNSTHIPPLLRIPFPDNIARHRLGWSTVSSWYLRLRSLESIYFNFFYSSSSQFQRLKLNIKPNLSDASLWLINISKSILDNPITSLGLTTIGHNRVSEYRICKDALVYFGMSVVLLKSGSVWFFEDFCEPGTGPMVQFRQMSEPWTGP